MWFLYRKKILDFGGWWCHVEVGNEKIETLYEAQRFTKDEFAGGASLVVLEGMRKWGPSCLALQTELYEIRLGTTRKRLALPIVIFGGYMLKP